MTDDSAKREGLAHLAMRAERDPFFVAFYLATYSAQNGLTLPQVAAYLQCAPNRLAKLMLCRAPDPLAASFHDDALRVSKFADCDPHRLGQLLREVVVLRAVGAATAQGGTSAVTLLAARDKHLKRDRSRGKPKDGKR